MIQDIISRVIETETLCKAKDIIDSKQKFVVTAHKSPDGDAIGSTLSMYQYLKKLGKEVTVVLNDAPGDNLSFIPGFGEVVIFDNQNDGSVSQRDEAIRLIKEAEAFIFVDFNTPTRIGDMKDIIYDNPAPKILLDHHLAPTIEDFDVCISFPEMCSACEVVYHFILESGNDSLIDKQLASTIYCGMMTDTGWFTYNSSRPEIFLIVSRLLQENIDKESFHRESILELERRSRLKGYVLQNKVQYLYEHKAAYFSLSKAEMKRFNHQKGDSEGFVNMPLDIKGIQVSAFFREEKNIIKISLRSKGDYPVNLIAEKFFNGGGHKNASGGEFFGSLQQAETLFLRALPLFDQYLS